MLDLFLHVEELWHPRHPCSRRVIARVGTVSLRGRAAREVLAYGWVVLAERLAEAEPSLWSRATAHGFLRDVGQGRAPSFGVWLAQDALFVADLIVFQSRLVARAPRESQRVLAEGVVGLVAELDWFDAQAGVLGVAMAAERLPATLEYGALLQRLDTLAYDHAVAALWLIERVYLEAWTYAAACGSGGPYRAAIAHWTDPGFAGYVAELEAQLPAPGQEPIELLRSVLVCEAAFWDMAGGGS